MSQISSYEQQAIDFLAATGTKFKSEFVEFGYHFDDDKQKRNIFKITLANSSRSYSFKFGSSIADSCKVTKQKKIDSNDSVVIYFGFRHTGNAKNIAFGYKIETTYPELKKVLSDERTIESFIDEKQLRAEFSTYRTDIDKMPKSERINGVKFDEIESKVRAKINDAIKDAQSTDITLQTAQADNVLHPTSYDVLTCLTKYEPGTFDNFCSDYGYDADSRKAYKVYKAVMREWKNIELLFTPEQIELLQEIN